MAPIIYPLGIIPERSISTLYLWPPTAVIEFSRAVLVDGTVPGPLAHVDLAAGSRSVSADADRRLPAVRAARGGVPVMSAAGHRVDGSLQNVSIPSVRRTRSASTCSALFAAATRFSGSGCSTTSVSSCRRARHSASWAGTAAGKSTLLKMLCGIYPPDSGMCRFAAPHHADPRARRRLESRAGRHRQVYLIGSVMGLSLREIRRSMDEILAFAELRALCRPAS